MYTELPYTDFEFVVGFDAEKKVTSCTGKFVVDNYDEAVSYTFSFTPTETSVNTVVAADGTVKHIYTLTGAKRYISPAWREHRAHSRRQNTEGFEEVNCY